MFEKKSKQNQHFNSAFEKQDLNMKVNVNDALESSEISTKENMNELFNEAPMPNMKSAYKNLLLNNSSTKSSGGCGCFSN